jgi:hypothetical protein
MLRQTNAAGPESGTIHYTYDPFGTPIAQRVPSATSNYYYLLSADHSVIRLIDNAGNVLGTYDYCPTGNPPGDIVLTTIALNNPIGYLGMYQDVGTKMLYSATYTDNNSGVITQICLLPVLGGQLGRHRADLPAPRPRRTVPGLPAGSKPSSPGAAIGEAANDIGGLHAVHQLL